MGGERKKSWFIFISVKYSLLLYSELQFFKRNHVGIVSLLKSLATYGHDEDPKYFSTSCTQSFFSNKVLFWVSLEIEINVMKVNIKHFHLDCDIIYGKHKDMKADTLPNTASALRVQAVTHVHVAYTTSGLQSHGGTEGMVAGEMFNECPSRKYFL